MYKGDYKKGEIEIERENQVFENTFATLFNDDVIFPSGIKGKYLRFEWNAPYGVMLLPRDLKGNILLVRNFRHETRRWSWEIPKGFGEVNLSPLECAKKELKEETGLLGRDWKLLKVLPNTKGGTYIYEVLVDGQMSTNNCELSEAISSIKFFKNHEILSMMLSDDIDDPMTMFFITYTLLMEE